MTEGAPAVTVGIPFHDEATFLADAIRSVLAQRVHDLEILLVDDGSTDGSLGIARSFRDPRITIVADGHRRHLPARLNEIVRRARAPLVARMDADDVMHPDRLTRQLDVMRADVSCDAVGTWAVLVDAAGRPFAVVEGGPQPPTAASALERGVLLHATMLARRPWLEAHAYDESLTRAEDRDLWCRTVLAPSSFRVVPECLYVVRVESEHARFLTDYVETQRQNRRIFWKHGPRAVGLARTARLVAESCAKAAIMTAMTRAGLAARLVRRRGRAPTAAEHAFAVEALEAARQRGSE